MDEITMRERVARAICRSHYLRDHDFVPDFMLEEWTDWLPEADAAIAAVQESTREEKGAGRMIKEESDGRA